VSCPLLERKSASIGILERAARGLERLLGLGFGETRQRGRDGDIGERER
jgi:hypothetical protein